jgi:hypothetical protein
MTIALVCAAIKTATNGLTAVTAETVPTTLTLTAYDPPPAAMPNAGFPLVYVLTGAARDSTEDADNDVEQRDYEVCCAVGYASQIKADIREYYSRALIPALKMCLMKYEGLGVPGVLGVKVTGDSGVIILPEYNGLHTGFIVHLTITELIARTYATGE